MPWTALANNQTVSFNNLQDAVNNGFFTALTSIPVSNEQITKTDASTYVNCDVTYAPFAAKASNQLVVKSNLVTTTTTTLIPPTTTTTTTQLIACQSSVSYSGGQAYPTIVGVDMGNSTGIAILTYNAFGVPDMFMLEWNSTLVFNSGYRGDSAYDYLGAFRSSFTSSLTGQTDPIYNTTYPDLTNYPDDGYPRVTSPGNGVGSFDKNLASPTITTAKVYAPMSGTAWELFLGCPGITTTTTTTVPPTTTSTTTAPPPPLYNYYTFTPCTGGTGTDYRSILALALNDVYSFAAYPPAVGCYQITSITATPNTNDLPTLYGPLTDCSDINCIQL
jgi:hypothetical protein